MPLIRDTPDATPRRNAAGFLYHGTPMEIERDRLTPRFNHTVGGQPGKFVFATDHPDLARCYALKNDNMFVIGFMPDETTPYCIIHDRDAYLAAGVSGTVYKFPGDGFKQVIVGAYATGEYVTRETVRLRHAERIPVTGLGDLLDRNVRVFSTPAGMAERDFLVALRRAQYNIPALERQGDIICETILRKGPAGP